MKIDKRKFNGGARPGTGPKIPPEDKKAPIVFYVKKKHLEKAKEVIKPIVDKINQG